MTADNAMTPDESAIECDCRFLREEIERLEHEKADLLNQAQHLKEENVAVSAINKKHVVEIESSRALIEEYKLREEDYQEQVANLVREIEDQKIEE